MKKKDPFYIVAFLIYLFLMIKFLILKAPLITIKNGLLNLSLKALWERLSDTQWLPFKLIIQSYNHQTMAMFFNGIGENLIWFIPLGFFMPKLYKKHKLMNIFIIGMMGGLIIEIFSFLAMGYPLRLDAMILAGFGSVVGYGLYKLL